MPKGIHTICIVLLVFFSVSSAYSYTPSQFDKISLKQNCQRELNSSFRDMAGTPSCDKLKKIELEENQPSYKVKLEQ